MPDPTRRPPAPTVREYVVGSFWLAAWFGLQVAQLAFLVGHAIHGNLRRPGPPGPRAAA